MLAFRARNKDLPPVDFCLNLNKGDNLAEKQEPMLQKTPFCK